MTETARVVVVGGGIWGCSIAYHLARAGVSDVLVLERGELASGNTSQAAGLIGQLRASELMARSIMAVVDRLTRWQAEHGEDSGFRQVGSLKLALTDARVRELEAQVAQARRWGLAAELIAPRDAGARVPLLETKGVKACAWVPTDGYAEPYTLAMALARGPAVSASECGRKRPPRRSRSSEAGSRASRHRKDRSPARPSWWPWGRGAS